MEAMKFKFKALRFDIGVEFGIPERLAGHSDWQFMEITAADKDSLLVLFQCWEEA
jgi:hypothetical protein